VWAWAGRRSTAEPLAAAFAQVGAAEKVLLAFQEKGFLNSAGLAVLFAGILPARALAKQVRVVTGQPAPSSRSSAASIQPAIHVPPCGGRRPRARAKRAHTTSPNHIRSGPGVIDSGSNRHSYLILRCLPAVVTDYHPPIALFREDVRPTA
jgi:hypothetical protein